MGEQPGYVAPAGWYIDPDGGVQLRWWSGLVWTDHRAPLTDHRPEPADESGPAESGPAERGAAESGAAESGAAERAPAHPLTRREVRQLEEQAAATLALPPPVTRIAPISNYGWEREAGVRAELPLRHLPVAEPVHLYRDIPSRWSSASVWVIAFMPWITVVTVFAAMVVATLAPRAWWWWLGALVLPFLLTLAAAQRDVKRLRIWRHTTVAHWAWSLLGPPGYLIARTVVLRRHAGLGSAPLWVWVANLVVVSVLVVMTLSLIAAAIAGGPPLPAVG